MSTRVRVVDRIPLHVRPPVQAQWRVVIPTPCIPCQESPNPGVVVARPQVLQAGGVGPFPGKYNDGIPSGSRASLENMAWLQEHIAQDRITKVKLLQSIAEDLGITTAQLAIAWLLRRKEVSSVITGATKLSQLNENIAAREAVEKLTEDVLESIEAILQNDPTVE